MQQAKELIAALKEAEMALEKCSRLYKQIPDHSKDVKAGELRNWSQQISYDIEVLEGRTTPVVTKLPSIPTSGLIRYGKTFPEKTDSREARWMYELLKQASQESHDPVPEHGVSPLIPMQ